MMQDSLVTIGLPTYNRAKFLSRAIDMFLDQTYHNIELVISDNASTDGTQKICEEYAKKDSRIRYIRQKENIGQLLNFRVVLNAARGKYFMLVADDDWWDPRTTEFLKNALDAHPEYGTAMGSSRRVYDDGEVIGEFLFSGENDLTKMNCYDLFYHTVVPGKKIYYFLYGMFRTELLRPLWQRSFPKCVRFDHVIMGEVALAMRFFSLPEVLYVKTVYRSPFRERYANDPAGKAYVRKDRLRYIKYVWCVWWRVVSSPGISLSRKFSALFFTVPHIILRLMPHIIAYGLPELHMLAKRIYLRRAI